MHFVFNEFALDTEQKVLWMNGNIVPLSPKAFDTLRLLVEGEGRIVTKQEFMEALWPDSFVEDSNLTQNIFVLRKVLGSSPDGRPYIETIPKRGYRFVGTLRREEAFSASRRAEAAEAPGAAPEPSVETEIGPEPVSGSLPEIESLDPGRVDPSALQAKRPPRKVFWRLVFAGTSALVLIAAYLALHWEPRPRVGGYLKLTNDGRSKDLFLTTATLVEDQKNIYFTEVKGNQSFLAQVPSGGGEVSYDAPSLSNVHVISLSADGRALLFGANWGSGELQPLLQKDLQTGATAPFLDIRAQDASWSSDRKRLAYAQAGKLFVRSADGATSLVASVKGLAYWPRWSPDGTVLRFTQNYDGFHDRLWEVGSDGKNLHQLLLSKDDNDHVCCGSWTRSGRGFVYLSVAPNNNSIHVRPEQAGVWNRWGQEPIDIPAAPLDRWIAPIPSLDGKHVFAIGEELHGQLVRIDPTTRRPEPFIGGISAEGVSFSPDGKNIAWTSYPEGTLWRSRSDGSGRVQLTQAPLLARFPRWSPDGGTIVFTAARPGSDWQLYTLPASGGEAKLLLHEPAGQGVATWSPDGKELAFGHLVNSAREPSDRFSIEILHRADGQIVPVPGSAGLWTARWSPDGRFLSAVTLDNHTLRLYDTAKGTWTDLAHGNINDVVWSPDSASLFFDTNIGADPILYRVQLSQRKAEAWADLRNLRRAAFFGPWLGVTPDGAPLLLEDTSIEELYSVSINLP